MEYLLEQFKQSTGIDLSGDMMAMQRIKEAAEAAKCDLSTSEVTEVSLPFIAADHTGPKHLQLQAHPQPARGSGQGPGRAHPGALPQCARSGAAASPRRSTR